MIGFYASGARQDGIETDFSQSVTLGSGPGPVFSYLPGFSMVALYYKKKSVH